MTKKQFVWGTLTFAVTFLIAVLILNKQVEKDHTDFYIKKFSLLAKLRHSAMESYLATAQSEISFWVDSELLQEVSKDLDDGWYALPGDHKQYLEDLYIANNPYSENERWKLNNAGDGTAYSEAHERVHDLAHDFIVERGYHDFMLIDVKGNIIYTVEKEADFASNLITGKYNKTGLASVFIEALKDESEFVHFTDFELYPPGSDNPIMFMAKRMHDDTGAVSGVAVIELDPKNITDIMSFTEGMGESGETYLVGPDHLMRSNSRFVAESTILKNTVDTVTINRALNGETGVEFTDDYRGIEVLSAYLPLEVGGNRWALVAEIDRAEIESSNPISTMFVSLVGLGTFSMGLFASIFIGRVGLPESEIANDVANDILNGMNG